MDGANETDEHAGAGLYRRLLRGAWGELDESVRRFHACGAAEGTFKVRRGASRPARLLARLLRLPPGGETVPLRLLVEPLEGGGERWRRTFDGADFVTEQRAHAGLLLAERAGPFETLFRLSAEGGALAYRSESAGLRVWRMKLRLPRRVAPRVEAWERAERGGVRVAVRVTSPLVGLLIEYEGLVRAEEGEAALKEEEAGC